VTLAIEGFSSQPLESLYRASSVIRRAAEFEATAVGQVEVLIGIESDQASRVAKALQRSIRSFVERTASLPALRSSRPEAPFPSAAARHH
jgi:hypothetical protein